VAQGGVRGDGGGSLILRRFTVGALGTNCYVVGCPETGEAMIIDPGFDGRAEAERVLKEVDGRGLEVGLILNTHGHTDHTAGNGIVKEATGAPILIHGEDAPMLTPARGSLKSWGLRGSSPPADRALHDGDTVQVGSLTFTALHTPGHTPGSVCLLGGGVVFTGDTLFAGSVGRTDLPASSDRDMARSLREKLMPLPDRVRVYPGHGSASTMERERRTNPFLRSLL